MLFTKAFDDKCVQGLQRRLARLVQCVTVGDQEHILL